MAGVDDVAEIGVTPEMIQAGEDALFKLDLFSVAEGWHSKAELVKDVFVAMLAVSRAIKR